MERTLRWILPQSLTGSVLLAAATHAFIYATVILVLALSARWGRQEQPTTMELSYETFSEPPSPKPVTPPKVDNVPKEIQDEKSAVAGTQKAPTPKVATGAPSSADQPTTPYYKIRPKYPRAALVAGVEGWVLLKIDIATTGDVENIRVVDGQQRSMFQDEARRAVEKWKYRPFTNGSGQPIKRADYEVRVNFRLADAN